jgi:hypothetical protein
VQVTSEFREIWRWYVTGRPGIPNSSSTLGVVFRVVKFLALWSVFCVLIYKLMPPQYWPFLRGILANPFLLLVFTCLYARGVVLDFLSTRLEQRTARPGTGGVLNQLSVLEEYRREYGRSDSFHTLYVLIGWVALSSMMVGGLYWFFSLP